MFLCKLSLNYPCYPFLSGELGNPCDCVLLHAHDQNILLLFFSNYKGQRLHSYHTLIAGVGHQKESEPHLTVTEILWFTTSRKKFPLQ